MCGILGLATPAGRTPSRSPEAIAALRDALAHRGPDDAGLWSSGPVILAHRRLAVIDVSSTGHQPMVSPDGAAALVYNGELYNDAELRRDLAGAGVTFRGTSDSETVLMALRTWGVRAVDRFRGMYALAYVNLASRSLFLARDPLGIKPLYWSRPQTPSGPEFAFASEVTPLVRLQASPRPDLVTVSAYLTTIRTTLGARTLFDGVQTLLPGQRLEVDLADSMLRSRSWDWWDDAAPPSQRDVRSAVEESVRLHLRSDVPTCCLLSGGLDSAIVSTLAKRESGSLRTYCSGATEGSENNDFVFAAEVAERIGSLHTEAPVTRQAFAQRWPEMIARTGLPLSTPNEVAINEVARRLRADGRIVTLSGEGADELFGGYEGPLDHARRFEERGGGDGGAFQLADAAWIPVDAKSAVLSPRVWRAVEHDHVLTSWYSAEFSRLAEAGRRLHVTPDEPAVDRALQTHLRFSRRVNLSGLLLRLDSATMLAGVEGRTPFADAHLALLAESLPMAAKFGTARDDGEPRTKRVLRDAFRDILPASVVQRPKASFPLPFQQWISDAAPSVRASRLAADLFSEEAMATVETAPERAWSFAWPMVNLALWARHWWG